jgi:hypothetical protein
MTARRELAALAAAGATAFAPGLARASECVVAGADLIAFAQSQGIVSQASKLTQAPATSCTEAWPAVTVSAPAGAPGGCRLDLFQHATLADGWKVKTYLFKGELTAHMIVVPSGAHLEMSLTATAPAGESGNITLKRVVLTGPDCDHWQDSIVAAAP